MMAAALLLALLALTRPRRLNDDAAMLRRENIAAARARLAALRDDESAAEAAEHETEIKNRLLYETEDIKAVASGNDNNRADRAGTAIAAAVLLPGVLALYLWLGAPAAIVTETVPPPLAQAMQKLRQHIEANPQDAEALALMGRSLATLGRPAEAAVFFARARAAGDDTLRLLLAHAGVLLAVEENKEQFGVLLKEVLARAPDSPQALWLAGLAAQRDNDSEAAAAYWRRAHALLAGDVPAQQEIAALLAAVGGGAAALTPAADSGIVVVVTVAEVLREQFRADHVLFVLARAAGVTDAPPLAVKKLTAGTLPLTVRLDDRAAMNPATPMSHFTKFDIAARIAKGGVAAKQNGDLSGAAAGIPLGATVTVHIDTVLGG